MSFILEIQHCNNNAHAINPKWTGKCEHLGYLNKVFHTKQEAGDYYNKTNTHMRPFNQHNHSYSECDPKTGLMYVIREHLCEYLKLPAFDQ